MVVAAGPTTITPVGTICAEEGDTCNCAGAVYLGRKFVSGHSGATTTLAQMVTGVAGYMVKQVSGSIECSRTGMNGADGSIHTSIAYLYCYCVPSTAGALLFSIGLSVYLSVCLFGWITFSSLLFPLIYL